MPLARKHLINVDTTPYYHCVARCVRRAFLCGECHLTGQSFEHRKSWVSDRLAHLSKLFAIDIAAYAVMSNHYHLVLRVNTQQAEKWSQTEVVERWGQLFSIKPLIEITQASGATNAIAQKVKLLIQSWKKRLTDISWFMRCLNEFLARKANKEDNCTGRFWEGRFKSHALLDEPAILTAMAYTDLNPIRSKVSTTIEDSKFTSIQQRINERKNPAAEKTVKLMELYSATSKTPTQEHKNSISITLENYVNLVKWSGRVIRDDKLGYIKERTPPILGQLNLQPSGFINFLKRKDDISGLRAIGSINSLQRWRDALKNRFIHGHSISQKLYIQA